MTDGECGGEDLPALLVHIDGLAGLSAPDTCEKNARLGKQRAEVTSCRQAEHVYRVRGGPSRFCKKDAVTVQSRSIQYRIKTDEIVSVNYIQPVLDTLCS